MPESPTLLQTSAYPSGLLGLTLLAPAGIEQVLIQYQILRPLFWRSNRVDQCIAMIARLCALVGTTEMIDQIKLIRQEMLINPMFRIWMQRALRLQKTRELIVSSLEQINCPALIIAGGQDRFTPLWQCQAYQRGIPVSRLVMIEDAEHTLPTDAPSRIQKSFEAYFGAAERCTVSMEPTEFDTSHRSSKS